MRAKLDEDILLESMTKDSARLLFPLQEEDMDEIRKWFKLNDDYSIKNEFQYLLDRELPYEDAIVLFYHGEPCGKIGLYDYNKEDCSIFLYYWVSSRYRGKGIAGRALKAVLEYLKTLEIGEVLFDVDKENTASIKMLERCEGVYLKTAGKYLLYAYKMN